MKNTILLLGLCFFTFIANAQKITEKELLGKWQITALDVSGNYIDFKKNAVSISDEWLKENRDVPRDQWEAQLKGVSEQFSSSTVTFGPGKTISLYFGGTSDGGNYDLVEKDGKTYLTDDKRKDFAPIEFKNGLMYWSMDVDTAIVIMIFEKVKE